MTVPDGTGSIILRVRTAASNASLVVVHRDSDVEMVARGNRRTIGT